MKLERHREEGEKMKRNTKYARDKLEDAVWVICL